MYLSLKAISFLTVVTCVLIILDFPIARQVLGFVFLSFVPGYLLLRVLRFSDYSPLDRVLFSLGLSISFVMFVGFFVNQVAVSLHLSGLLSTLPLLGVIFGSSFVLIVACYLRERGQKTNYLEEKHAAFSVWLIVLCVIPILGAVGAIYQVPLITVVMILAVSTLFVAATVFKKAIPDKIYPLIIAVSSIALLFNTVLISKYLMGTDVFIEFNVFRNVDINGFWQPPGNMISYTLIDSVNSLLSVTLLPAVYTNLLQVSGDVFFKVFYPFLFAFVPLILYRMYEKQTNKKIALLSVFFFISVPIAFFGIEMMSLDRQIVGQFFMILAIYTLAEPKMGVGKKLVLPLIFGVSLIVSHYSIAYIFLVYLIAFYIITRVKFFPFRKTSIRSLRLGFVLLMVVLTFSWYLYISSSPLNQLEASINKISSLFTSDFADLGARGFGPGALQSASPFAATTFLGAINKILVYIEHLFIVIGVLVLIIKPKEFSLTSEYRLLSLSSAIFLGFGLLIPNLSLTLNMTRFYSILLPFLAPFVVLGGMYSLTFLKKRIIGNSLSFKQFKKWSFETAAFLTIACILAATFLFQTGFIGHVSNGYPYSYSLDLSRREASTDLSIQAGTHSGYFLDTEVFGAKWLVNSINNSSAVYGDDNSMSTVLKSYASQLSNRTFPITSMFVPRSGVFTYLKYLNLNLQVFATGEGRSFNASEVFNASDNFENVYSNGNSVIFYSP